MRVPAAERKAQLIKATVAVMRRDGVQQLTLRDVAKEAGAPLAAVHYCFQDKDDLLRHAVDHWLSKMVEAASYPEPMASKSGLAATGRVMAERFWADFEAAPDDVLAQLELVTWAARNQHEGQLARTIYISYEKALSQVFTDALRVGRQSHPLSPEQISRAFLVIIDGCALQYLADPSSAVPKQLLDALLEGLWGQARRATKAS